MTDCFVVQGPGWYWRKDSVSGKLEACEIFKLDSGLWVWLKGNNSGFIAPVTMPDVVAEMKSALIAAKTWWEEYNDPCGEPYNAICAALDKADGKVSP